MRRLVFLLAVLFCAGQAHAHQTSLSYINVTDRDGAVAADMKLSLLDLEVAVGVDQDLDGKITWGEAKASLDRIAAYAQSRTALSAGGRCNLARSSAAPETLNGEGYLALLFKVECPVSASHVQVASSLFLDIDPTSRVLVSSRTGGQARTYVLGIEQSPAIAAAAAPESAVGGKASFLSYLNEGLLHLFGGLDHLLFLLVLIVPAVHAGGRLGAVAAAILLPITGFTLGHALTLTSAASGLIRPSAQIVESLIAVTILLTAIDNIRRFIPGPRSVVAFVFGLIHGFGFAGALGALDVTGWQMAVALLGFNLGIEAGQAILALAAAPVLIVLWRWGRRTRLITAGVSVLVGGLAVYWIAERALLA